MRVTASSPVFILQIIFASVIISHTNSQSATITLSLCNSASDCTECMAANPLCNWCITKSTSGWSGTKRCDTYSNLISKSCLPNDIKNITTEVTPIREDAVRDATDEGLPAIQVSPQNIKIKLRPNEKVKVPLTFRLAKDYPVDLYYLMDLSQSMADDKKKVADLGINLANEMRKITKDVRLGFGSFVDKVLMPYVNTLESRLESPCSNCESPYSYKHRLDLTQNTAIFGDRVNGTQVSGNLDGPEGGFDALMQAIVCGEVIGWRSNSRKMLIFSTDASFHSAGDGKLGGVVEPNDGLCHMSNGEYVYGTKQDYPSISQIASKVADYRVNVIFAVTKDQTGRYENLRELIPGSVTGTLANDSSNIVGLVRENYEKISSKVVMTIKRDNRRDDLKVKVRADCTNSGSFSDTAECDKLSPGDEAKFEVELQATSCDNINGVVEETFEVYPTGLAESLQITAQIDCSCTCDDAETNSPACSGVGTYRCAVCECDATSYGDLCQCDVSNAGSDTTDLNAPCVRPSNSSQVQQPCSGRGECVCGVCETCDCLPGQSSDKQTCRRFTGHYCQCNPDNCPRNSLGICSGRGSCTCDQDTAVHTCQCDEGYSGTECECQISQETCKDPSNTEDPDLRCNGQGECICGKCKCYVPQDGNSERFTGRYCEECSGCPSKCQPFKQCVQCKVYEEKGWNEGSYDADYCAQSCGNGSNIEFAFVPETPSTSGPEIRQCSPYTSVDDCQVFYAYRYLPNRGGYTVYIKDEKECPYKPNLLAIILGVVGGIVFIGIVILLIWKLATTLHDRREFAKFEKERSNAQWKSNENPIYVQATSTFKNPMYQGTKT